MGVLSTLKFIISQISTLTRWRYWRNWSIWGVLLAEWKPRDQSILPYSYFVWVSQCKFSLWVLTFEYMNSYDHRTSGCARLGLIFGRQLLENQWLSSAGCACSSACNSNNIVHFPQWRWRSRCDGLELLIPMEFTTRCLSAWYGFCSTDSVAEMAKYRKQSFGLC